MTTLEEVSNSRAMRSIGRYQEEVVTLRNMCLLIGHRTRTAQEHTNQDSREKVRHFIAREGQNKVQKKMWFKEKG